MKNHTIKIIEVYGEDYFEVTINGDTWSVKTVRDALEMCEEILINDKLSESEQNEILAGENKHNLNGGEL